MRHHQTLNTQRGIVIVVALFVVALIATMSYVMLTRLSRDTERTTLILHSVSAENAAEGSILWAIDTLRENLNKKKQDQLVDVLPMTSPSMTVGIFTVQSSIDDMQARFNINNLTSPKALTDFVKLLKTVQSNLSEEEAIQITKAVSAWINSAENELDKYYLQLPIPYRAAHRLMQNASELQLVKGVTPKLYQALKPFIIALPVNTQINMQTATPEVIATLAPNFTLDAANALVSLRQAKPFKSVQDVLNLDIVKNYQLTADKMTVTSNYFLVKTTVSIENQTIVLYTLLERMSADGKAGIKRLATSKGIWQ